MKQNTKKFKSPYLIFGFLALICTVIMVFYFYRWNFGALLSYILAINLITLFLYAYDKLIAGRSLLRVPEKVLHGLAIVGGSPAGLVAQKVFRHKTVKKSFQLIYWSIVVLQLIFVVWYFTR